MEKIVSFSPAFDKRHADPAKNYGIHGVDIRFVLKGKSGAVQFLIYTNWHLPKVQNEMNAHALRSCDKYAIESLLPMPADFGYHSKCQQYEGQESITDSCEYCDGQPCYYDGSSLYAETVYKRLVQEGDSGVWDELQKYYEEKFGVDQAQLAEA